MRISTRNLLNQLKRGIFRDDYQGDLFKMVKELKEREKALREFCWKHKACCNVTTLIDGSGFVCTCNDKELTI